MRPLHMLLCLTAACTLAAQESQPKIGILVPDRIVESSARGRMLFAKLDDLKQTLGKKLQDKASEIQRLESQLQSPSISNDGKEKIQKQLRDLDFENKKLQDDSNTEFQKTQQQVVSQFQKELGPIVEDLAKEKKLTLVLQYQPGMVAWADQKWLLEFSDEVARRYDAKYPAQGGAAPAAPKPVVPAK